MTIRPRLRPAEWLALGLGMLCVLLLAWNAWQWLWSSRDIALAVPADVVAPEEVVMAGARPPGESAMPRRPESIRAIVERNLFNPGRAPVPVVKDVAEPEPVQAPEPVPPLRLTLESVLISGDRRYAMVVRERTGESLSLAPDARINGWIVQSIQPKAVSFLHEDSGREQRIELFPVGTETSIAFPDNDAGTEEASGADGTGHASGHRLPPFSETP